MSSSVDKSHQTKARRSRVWITGWDGFLGSHVMAHLRSQGWAVEGLSLVLPKWGSVQDAMAHLEKVNASDFERTSGQGVDSPGVQAASRALGGSLPTIIHFAGISHVPTCDRDPELAYGVNATGTALLLEGLRRLTFPVRFVFASTAQVYAKGEDGGDWVFTEESRICPQNLYARTKLLGEKALLEASASSSIRGEILRIFNHTHRSQSPDFFLPHLFKELQAAKQRQRAGERVQIPVGNLDLSRDLGCVSDFCSAVEAVLLNEGVLSWAGGSETDSTRHFSESSKVDRSLGGRPQAGVPIWNVSSGTPKNLRKLAHALAKSLECKAEFVVDPSRVRAGEPTRIVGSHDRLTRATGWLPRAQTESDLIDSFLAGPDRL